MKTKYERKQMKIKYVEGDLFGPVKAEDEDKTIFICHVANNLGIMGSGFVVPLARHFPQAKEKYVEWHETSQNSSNLNPFALGETQFVKVYEKPKIIVANMVAQNNVIRNTGGLRPLRYNALAKCMDKVSNVIAKIKNLNSNAKIEIISPSFGSNLAGGEWLFIEELIQDCWLNEGIPVTIYYLKGTLPQIENKNN